MQIVPDGKMVYNVIYLPVSLSRNNFLETVCLREEFAHRTVTSLYVIDVTALIGKA